VRIFFVAVLLVGLLNVQAFPQPSTLQPTDDAARGVVKAAVAAMGGEDQLRALKSVQLEGIGHTNFLEQSERPEGPWLVGYEQSTELRDFANERVQRVVESRSIQIPQWRKGPTTITAGGVAAMQFGTRSGPGSWMQVQEAQETLAFAPERALLTALGAKDLRLERETTLQGGRQHVVAFSWQDATARLYLNAQTKLPTAVEVVRAYPGDFFWGIWGEVRTRTYLSLWMLEAGGMRYPRQWNVERNGMPFKEFTVTKLSLNANVSEDSFSISEDVRKGFAARGKRAINDLPLGLPSKPAVEIAPGLVQIPGAWNVALVRQADGIVVVEAPISSGYSAKVIEEAGRRFSGVPVKAVISTSDAWPHIGGARQYAASGISIYALDLNRPILERLLAAPYRTYPDMLARAPRKPNLRVVSNKTTLGTGSNRMELYPIRSESGERMIMIYFPEHKLLYGSDLLQQMPDGSFFMPQYVSELVDAVRRENLTVDKVFAMHLGITPWANVLAALEKAKAAS
jgi:hypothetical protein